jgi:Protein of unknown function (DUF3305)
MKQHPAIRVAVVMERVAAPNAWEDWQFRVAEVVPDQGAFGGEPRKLHDDGKTSRWLHPGFVLELFADECKGYFLNLTSGRPAWFVSWRAHETDPSSVEVTAVSVSYIEADRRLFAEERVENLPLEAELCEWLRLFTNQHFKPEGARKVRAQSFLSPEQRQPQPDADLIAPQADARMRNEAVKRIFFGDPHFNTPDGLDVHAAADAACEHAPQARQQQIRRARALGLLDDELTEQERPADDRPPPSQ